MARKRGIKGRSLPVRAPEWEPLLNVASRHLDEFMWMFAVELADGTRLQAYKHYWTRNYLHLDGAGRAFVYIDPDRYEEFDLGWALFRVLGEDVIRSCGLRFSKRTEHDLPELVDARISFRVAVDVLSAAQKRADREEISLSELAAKALREHLDR